MKILKRNKYSILQEVLKYSFIIIFAVFFMASSVIAVEEPTANVTPADIDCSSGAYPADICPPQQNNNSGVSINTTINNPLGAGNLEDIPSFIEALLNIVLVVGVPIVTLAIIYSGFLFVSARGNPEEIKKAKSALLYTIIGATLLLGSWVLAKAIGATVDEIKKTT